VRAPRISAVGTMAAVVGLAAMVSIGSAQAAPVPAGPVGAGVAARSAAASFTAADVGFAEGSSLPVSLGPRLDAMVSFVSGRSPMLRVDLDWAGVQPCPTCALDWTRLDKIMTGAKVHGMRVLLILDYAPSWASGGHEGDKWFPTDDATWASIVGAAVDRYSGGAGPAVAFEVWNEPNVVGTFSDYATDPKVRYWQLVRVAGNAVHTRCPSCVVLAGASANGSSDANESALWLDWAYRNGYGSTFDAVAHHPYPAWNVGFGPARPECDHPKWNMFGPPGESPACGELARVHAVMVAHGDTTKKIWATEWGYPTSGATGIGLGTIRNYMVQGVAMWRALAYTGPLFLFSYADACTTAGDPECNYGVVTSSLAPKNPLYTALSAALRSTGVPCAGGSVSPPDDLTPVDSLDPGQCISRATALTSPSRRYQLWLQNDGNLVLYRASGATALWATHTTNGIRLENRTDGTLRLVRSDGTTRSLSPAGTGAAVLRLQNDGNLVLYRIKDGKALWATGTAQ
jgi:hypothetical protein